MEERPTEALDFLPRIDEGLPAGERRPCLIALTGPEKGASFPLPDGESVLGRSAEQATVVLTGPGLSRAHTRVRVAEGRVQVWDLGSTNGTFVNGEKVEEFLLEEGDTLGLGPSIALRLEYPDPAVHEVFADIYKGATQDGLTGLLNRKSFLQRLTEEHAASRRHGMESCVALVDVDHFKSVNDTWGHPAGDAVLVELARRLEEAVRTEDVVGRYGGEEFIALLRYAPLEGGRVVLERLRESVASREFRVPVPEGERALPITLSAGLARLVPAEPPESAIERADRALYEAKRSGRNRVCTEEDLPPLAAP